MPVTLLRGPGVRVQGGVGVHRQPPLSNGNRIWEVGDLSGLPRTGLVALWDPYRDAYGLDATARAALQTGVDYSGRGNTLTYGANTNASTDDPSNTGTAWSLDGGDYLTRAISLSNSAGRTLIVCCNVTTAPSAGTYGIFFGNGTPHYFGYIGVGANTVAPFASSTFGGVQKTLQATATVAVGTPYCSGVVVRQGVGMALWTSGTKKPSAEYTADIESTTPTHIGCFTPGSSAVIGTIFLIAVYDRPLGDAEYIRTYTYLKSLMASRGVTLA